MLFFYINKDFYSRISFYFNIINYVIIRKRLNAIKTKNIINHIKDVLAYIRDNVNKIQLVIIE